MNLLLNQFSRKLDYMKRLFRLAAVSLFLIVGILAMAQQQGPPKPPDPVERLQHVSETLSKGLNLSDAQKEKVNAAYKQFFSDMDKLREKNPNPSAPPPPPPPPGKKEDIDKLVKVRDEQIRSVLQAAQYKKYLDLEKTMRPPMPGQDKKAAPPPVNK